MVKPQKFVLQVNRGFSSGRWYDKNSEIENMNDARAKIYVK